MDYKNYSKDYKRIEYSYTIRLVFIFILVLAADLIVDSIIYILN